MGDPNHPLSSKDLTDDDSQEVFSRPRSTSIQSRRSWPLIPTLEVTSSAHSNSYHHTNISPIIDKDENISTPTTTSDSESSVSSEFGASDKEKDLAFEIDQNDTGNIQNKEASNDSNGRRGTLGGTRRDSAGTLVEAALDQVEARDRHVRFPDHIAEAGSLVERMLSTRRPSSNHTPLHQQSTTIDEAAENDLNSIERQQTQHTHKSPNMSNSSTTVPQTGGSVLASLMKLESQRRQPTVKRRKTIKKKKVVQRILFFSELLY